MTHHSHAIIDLFCGTGGFAHGFVGYDDGLRLVYAVDIDESAAETAKANHGKSIVETKDIRKISPRTLRKQLGVKEVDVIIGGPPCQGFSSLRPNRSSSVEDERNSLFVNFASFVDVFRPKVVVMENVVGLLTYNDGRTLDKLLTCFGSLGYNVDWRILNAASYGVPQKRERFVMIAGRDHASIMFPQPTHHFTGKVVGYKDKNRFLLADAKHARALTVNDAISDLPALSRRQQALRYDRPPENAYQRARRKGSTHLELHKAANHSDKMIEVIRHAGESISCIPSHLVTSGFSSCYSRLDGDEPSTTITVKFQSPASSKCIHPTQDRTITPREAARIQSFDDSYIFKGPLTRIAAQLGNAVPPLLGRAIARSVCQMLS